MQFGNIHFIWLLGLLPLLIFFYVWALRRKNYLIEKFVSPTLRSRLLAGVSPQRQRLKVVLIICAVAAAVVALIRPKYGFHWEEVQRRGVDIVIALDVSKSMMAEDVSPNRLDRAKREIIDFLELVTGDRIALVAFAGEGFLQCPLTLDYGAVRIFLDDLDTDLIPIPGTSIGDAIAKGIAAYDPDDKRARAMILITDGEDNSGRAREFAAKAKEQQIRIYSIGIGKEGGAPIPESKQGGFKKNRAGELILSKLDEETLQKIALATDGSYVRATTGNLELESIYKDIRAKIEDKELSSGRRQQFEERFQWPLALALILLCSELLVREKKRVLSSVLLAGVIAAAFNSGDLLAHPFSPSAGRQGEKAYREHNYSEALNHLLAAQIEDPHNWQIKYNTANTYYNMGEYDKAQQLYQDIATNGPQELTGKTHYNLGNTAFRQGKLEDAIKHYEKSLALNPQDEDAKANLNFVREEIKRRLEEQKKRQEQQQQNQDQQSQDQQKQNQQKQDQKQQGQEQQKDQQGQQKDQQKEDQQQGQDQKQDQQQKQDQKEDQQQKQEQKEDQQQKQGQEQKQEQKEQEKDKQGGQEKQEEKQGQDKGGEASPPPADGTKEQGISKEEALQLLDSLQGDRKEYIKKKFKGARRYDVEKDW
jgi:Ca-activated chloride channel family protein